MRRTLLVLTVAALASLAAAAHADDGATHGSPAALPQARQSVRDLLVALGMPDLARALHRRSATPAELRGKGTLGEACHSWETDGDDKIYEGTYSDKAPTSPKGGTCGAVVPSRPTKLV
jgi:hypothetical protein